MNKRKFIVSAVGLLILVIITYIFNMDNKKNGKEKNNKEDKVEVSVKIVHPKEIAKKIKITGRIIPKNKQDIALSVGGQLEANKGMFKTGQYFKKGQLIAAIDTSEINANLISKKSNFVKLLATVIPDLNIDYPEIYPQWKKYLEKFDVEKKLKPLPKKNNPKAKLFLAGKGIYTNFYAIMEIQSKRDKYKYYAPFDGVLTDALVDEGAIVAPNKKIGEYISKGIYEIETTIPNNQLPYINKNDYYAFVNDNKQQYKAKVIRINDVVEEKTQSVRAFFEVKSDDIKVGTYLSTEIDGEITSNAVAIPDHNLVDENHVFVVENEKAKLHRVKLIYREDGYSIVQALNEGATVIMESKPLSFEATEVKTVPIK